MRPSPLSPRQRLAPAYASASPSSVPRPPSSPARGSLIKTRFLDDKKGQLGTVTPPLIKVSKVPTLNSPRLTVLSIDGGGMRGVIPARVLKELEVVIKDVIREHWSELKSRVQGEAANLEQAPEVFDVDLADYFDLMAGTSTGSILATYLASKGEFLSPDLLKPGVRKGSVDAALNVFASQGKTIFPRPQNEAELQLRFSSFIDTLTANSILARLPQSWRYALYSQVLKLLGVPVDGNGTPGKPWSLDDDVRWKVLSAARVMYTKEGVETVLKKVFGDGNLSDGLKTSLLVSSYDLETSGPLLFCYVHDKQAAERFHGYVNLAGREQSGAEASAKKRSADPAASAIIMPELQYNLAPQTETAPHAQQTTHRDGFLPENTEKASRLDFKLWQVVRSSTAAPTFFPPANVEGLSKENTRKTFKLVDGGVCCNNPEAAALAFAMHVAAMKGHNDLRLHDAAVLSIGCGATASARVIDDTAGQLSWLGSAGLVSMFMEGANDLTTGLVQMLDADKMASGFKMQKNQLMRVQAAIFGRPPTDPLNQVLSRMDNPDDFDQLLTVGDILAQERHDEMKDFVKKFIFKLT